MKALSAFLSHTSDDKPLVEQVARALGPRGIVPWLDVQHLYPGLSLSEALPKAIDDQHVVVAFLSFKALESKWMFKELEHALGDQRERFGDRIVPVFLDDPKILVKAHDLLRDLWLDEHGAVVDRLGVVGSDVERIADGIARRLYADLRGQSRLAVGVHTRAGTPDGPDLAVPALLFRPDGLALNPPARGVLEADAWTAFAAQVERSLAIVAGGRSPRGLEVHLFGHAQLAVPFLVGRHFDRTSGVHLHGHDRNGGRLSLDLRPFLKPLDGGEPECERTDDRVPPLRDAPQREISLLLMRSDGLDGFDTYRRAAVDVPPAVWVPTGHFDDIEQVLALMRDVTALLMRLRRDPWRVQSVRLFTTLPFHVLPFVAALSTHVVRVTFMEYRQGAADSALYQPLDFPEVH